MFCNNEPVHRYQPAKFTFSFQAQLTSQCSYTYEICKSAVEVQCYYNGGSRAGRQSFYHVPETQAGSVVIAKDENDEQTVLMLAAATGNPEVFEKVASMLPRGKVSMKCKRSLPVKEVRVIFAARHNEIQSWAHRAEWSSV